MHIVNLATEYDLTIGSEQNLWLADDLAAVDRTVTPWVVVTGHRAGYVDSDYSNPTFGGQGDVEFMAVFVENIEPLLIQFGADLCFWGHSHNVQRMCAVEDYACVTSSVLDEDTGYNVYTNPGAPVHMVVGTGGAPFSNIGPGLPYTEVAYHKWGYARVHGVDENTLNVEWVNSRTHEVADKMTIQRAPVSDDDESPVSKQLESASGPAAIAAGCLILVGLGAWWGRSKLQANRSLSRAADGDALDQDLLDAELEKASGTATPQSFGEAQGGQEW